LRCNNTTEDQGTAYKLRPRLFHTFIVNSLPLRVIPLPLRTVLDIPGGNVTSKAKVPEPPTFVGSENKMYLHDWLSQIALYCSASGIIVDDQKIMCALTRLHAPAYTYMKSYYDKVQTGQGIGSWGNFSQEFKIFTDKEMTRREQRRN